MYFFSDLILSAALYFVIVELYRIILPSRHWKLLRRCFLILFVLMALLSYATIQQSSVLRATSFSYQLSSNLFFQYLGMILLLWVTVSLRGLPWGIAPSMVRVWGIYFLLLSAGYLIFALLLNFSHSTFELGTMVRVMAEAWLPLGLVFAILNSPDCYSPVKS